MGFRASHESCLRPLLVRAREERRGRPPGMVTREGIGESAGRACRGSSWTWGFSYVEARDGDRGPFTQGTRVEAYNVAARRE